MNYVRYRQIADELRQRCHVMTIGDRLPPERTLAVEFEASVLTVRRALSELAEEGWIRRAAGSGTFVTRPTVQMGPLLTSFSEDMAQRGFAPSSTLLRSELADPDVETVARLGLRASERVLIIERLRYADGEPMCLELSVFPERFAQLLLGSDLTGSIHETLRTGGSAPQASDRAVRAVVALRNECELLELPPGSPALEITDTFVDSLGQAMQYARSRYRFDRYEVRARIDTIDKISAPSDIL